jgi:hypothetical protein
MGEERSSDLKGVRDLDHIRDHLKMTAHCDSNYFVYCRIGNTGRKAIVFNEHWVGYFEAVKYECDGEFIRRDRHQANRRAYTGSGASLYDNVTFPGRTLYRSHRSNYWGLRYGPGQPHPTDPKVITFRLITPPPQKGMGISFRDDLLDLDWQGVDGDRVEVVIRQRLANVLPTKRSGTGKRFFIESNPIMVEVKKLKAYKEGLSAFREEVMQKASMN